MLKELSYIKLSGETFPMKMDNLVLQEAQREYGSLKGFEIKLIGAEVYQKEDGTTGVRQKEPDIAVANFILPKMVREGYAILGEECEHTEEDIIRMIDMNIYVLADAIHEEYRKAMQVKEPKKENPNRTKKKKLSLIGYILQAVQCWDSQRMR